MKKSLAQINDDSHLLHIASGHGRIYLNAQAYPLAPGLVAAIPPFTDFYFDLEPGFEMRNLHYRIWLENGELLENCWMLPVIFAPAYFADCLKMLDRTRKCSEQNPATAAMAHEIILRHWSSTQLTPSIKCADDDRLNSICKILQSPDCMRYDAAKMARQCFLSPSQMNRRFKCHFKLSPHEFWEKNRFKFVCRALLDKNKTIAEIANKFSFNDQAYFSKWFKKLAGDSPSAYRRKNCGGNNFFA